MFIVIKIYNFVNLKI